MASFWAMVGCNFMSVTMVLLGFGKREFQLKQQEPRPLPKASVGMNASPAPFLRRTIIYRTCRHPPSDEIQWGYESSPDYLL